LRRQLYRNVVPDRILLRSYGELRHQEAKRHGKHVFDECRVFKWPLLGRRALLQF
jgi:hypothetical protein